mgnify:CR=1 FL=1
MKSSDPVTATVDPFEAALTLGDVEGRSPWEDAWHRLLKNRAAVVSGPSIHSVVPSTMVI